MSSLHSTGVTVPGQNIPLVPRVTRATWAWLADWQDKARLSRVTTSEGTFGPPRAKEMQGELSPAETLSLAAPDELGQSAEMEWDGQPGRDAHKTRRVPAVSSEKAGEGSGFSSLCFPQKLWKMAESDQFQSLWWSEGGKCLAINEELFKEEVLGRGGPLRVFATHSMKSFTRQLNIYGFTKMQRDAKRSASLPEFLAEEAAASAHSKVQQLLCTSTDPPNSLGGETDLPVR
nr:PREDICTED: heat shock factor protein-like [Opisthocomus hoazin]